jgi:glycosyltransferase involved in cell wall biosynthesis
MHGGEILPMPVDRKRFRFTRRPSAPFDGAPQFLHLAAPAMLDRNGTGLVAAALHHVRTPIRLKTRGLRTAAGPLGGEPSGLAEKETVGQVSVAHWPPSKLNIQLYDAADVLVLPRRYGGLSMPMLEAASLGMPVITLNVPPQSEWFPPDQLVPILAQNTQRDQMIGGRFEVYDARPEALADVIDRFATEPDLVARCSKLMDDWAETNSWDALRVHWIKTLGL